MDAIKVTFQPKSSIFGHESSIFRVHTISSSSSPVVGVLDEPYSAKPAQWSIDVYGSPGYIDYGHGSSLCRLAGLYGFSAERV